MHGLHGPGSIAASSLTGTSLPSINGSVIGDEEFVEDLYCEEYGGNPGNPGPSILCIVNTMICITTEYYHIVLQYHRIFARTQY